MAALPQFSEEQLKLVQDIEIEMMTDMFNRMTTACHKKCIPPKYATSELTKGESVCLDRCIAKYLDVQERIGKKLQQISMQDGRIVEQPNLN
ncbi:Mitochondrial import inner membrane translocase subunit Tim10 [Anthophora quadrimaculata]